jgi:hypothetical protein
MRTTTIDPIDALVSIDPVPKSALAALDGAPARDRTYELILARRASERPSPRRRSRRLAIAVIAAAALAVPATLLAGGQLRSLLGFSTEGTPVEKERFGHLTAILRAVNAGEVKLLAEREGVAFYIARTEDGRLCPFTGPAGRPTEHFEFGCMNRGASARFPSPQMPVLNIASLFGPGGGPRAGAYLRQLRGFAADGVAKVQALDAQGGVIVEAVVEDNVYATGVLLRGTPPSVVGQKPVSAFVARDERGRIVWSSRLDDFGSPRASP